MSSGAGQAEMGGAVFAKEIYEVGIPDSAEAQDDLVALAENAMDVSNNLIQFPRFSTLVSMIPSAAAASY